MAGLEISINDYWKNTLKSAESTLAMLSVLEGKNVQGVDKAIESLRDLVAGGDDFNKVKSQQQQQQQQKKQEQQHYQQPSKKTWNYSSNYDMEHDWLQVSPSHIEVPLHNNKIATCIAVSTEQQLDEAIEEIKQAKFIAIDCEFQAVKKALPELKLLQIGVTSTKGFAIQVDIIGVDILSKKLKPILEDDHMNIVGWSYRPDALAIESFFKSIDQAPVLDLQAKLLPVAVETLNLEAAMIKFAEDWDGLEAFRKAKHYGDGFYYKDDDCIWLNNPLPPKALVYSIFDVLSVHALYECTTQYPDDEKFYWPLTLTSNQSDKAINRLHLQRAQGIASPAASSTKSSDSPSKGASGKAPIKSNWNNNYKSTSPTYRNKDKQRRQQQEEYVPVSPQPETDDGYDDNDSRHIMDLQKAIARSVQEAARKDNQFYGGESSSSVISDWQEDNAVIDHVDDGDDTVFAQEKAANEFAPAVDYPSWGEYDPSSHPFFGTGNSSAAAKTSSSDYDPPTIEAIAPVLKSPALPAMSAPVPVRQPMPPPTIASPQFQQQKVIKSPQQKFSRPQTTYHNKQTYQAGSSAQQQKPQQQQRHYQHQPSPQQQQPYVPKPVAFTPRNNYNPSWSPRKSFNNSVRPPHPPTQSQSAPPVVAPPADSINKSPVVTNASTSNVGFKGKPSKEKYASDFQNRIVLGDQSGSFTWSQDAENGVGAASWASFASSTDSNWKKGIDTEMTDWEKSQAKQRTEAASSQAIKKEGIKFNTVVSPAVGGTPNPLDNGNGDNWTKEEERPDTMEMRMNQIPIRKNFSGPRMMNPDDGESDTDDGDDDDDGYDHNFNARHPSQKDAIIANVGLKLNLSDTQISNKQKEVEKLPIFVDAIYPYSFKANEELAMLTLTTFEHLDMIIVPEKPFTVTICFHTMETKPKGFALKALQLYLSTGESYTCVLEKACEIRNRSRFKSTVFGRLLSDPSINRVCWYPEFIKDAFIQILGFSIGPTIDLALKVIQEDRRFSFAEAVGNYLVDWPDVEQYFELKEGYDNNTSGNSKKFAGSCWDRQTLPEEVLKYCAIQGLTAYALYQKTLELGIEDDDDFVYPIEYDDDDDDEDDA